jgi:hypothetical protein
MMKEKFRNKMDEDLRPEYDLSELLKTGVRKKYAERFRAGTNLVLIEPDIAKAFPTDQAVNGVLRLVIQLTKIANDKKRAHTEVG